MFLIEIENYGTVTNHRFLNGDDAEAFRTAAEKSVNIHDGPVKVTLWYRGYVYDVPANEIAHYYHSYPGYCILYTPDGKALWEGHSPKALFEWAKRYGINTVVYSQYEAARLNGYNPQTY